MGELDEQWIVILLLSAKSLCAALKHEGQQRRKVVKRMSQQARADVVFRPWLTKTEAAEQSLRQRSALSTPKGVSKAGVALGSFTGRKDGLTLDRPTLATNMSRATVLDRYKADPACRGSPYGPKCTHGGGRGARVGVQGGYDRTRPVRCATMSTKGRPRKNPTFKVCASAGGGALVYIV
jgi:hypothetical protein